MGDLYLRLRKTLKWVKSYPWWRGSRPRHTFREGWFWIHLHTSYNPAQHLSHELNIMSRVFLSSKNSRRPSFWRPWFLCMPNGELKQMRKWGLFHFKINLPYHICGATSFSLNELDHECKKSTSNWRASLKKKKALLRTAPLWTNVDFWHFTFRQPKLARFEFPTTFRGSEWMGVSWSFQTNRTTSWGKSQFSKVSSR